MEKNDENCNNWQTGIFREGCALWEKSRGNRWRRYYSAGDMFVFPGIRESLGMVYLESQSCGLPVVAFHNGGIPEVVVDGETGFLTPALSV